MSTALRFASLGSGSRGNALLVESEGARILVDCGFSARQLRKRLARHQLTIADLDAILITHEHSDHAGGIESVMREESVRTLASTGTCRAVGVNGMEAFNAHRSFALGDIQVQPVPVPHDAREPVQYVLESRGARLGVLTDLGHISRHVAEAYSNVDGLVLECNHDLDMLWAGSYPPSLKRRVAGDLGHLNNHQAASLLGSIPRGRLQSLVVAHVSEQNNQPDLALAALAAREDLSVTVADQESGFDWLQLAAG